MNSKSGLNFEFEKNFFLPIAPKRLKFLAAQFSDRTFGKQRQRLNTRGRKSPIIDMHVQMNKHDLSHESDESKEINTLN